MRIATMPDTCTGLHFYSFAYDGNSKSVMTHQANQIRVQLNQAKAMKYVNVFAFLIATQEESKKQLEEFGFVCAADHHNYKYPESSKRLYMMVKDMNDWEPAAAPKVTNTFATMQRAAPVNPAPVQEDAQQGPYRDYRGRFVTRPNVRLSPHLANARAAAQHNQIIPEGTPWSVENLIYYSMERCRQGRARFREATSREAAIQLGIDNSWFIRN